MRLTKILMQVIVQYSKRRKFGEFGDFAYFCQTLFIQSLILQTFAYTLDKFAKLYVTKFIAMQFRQTYVLYG